MCEFRLLFNQNLIKFDDRLLFLATLMCLDCNFSQFFGAAVVVVNFRPAHFECEQKINGKLTIFDK